MGLDMYLYKISKPKLDKKKVYKPDNVDASYIKIEDLENNQIPYSMKKYCEEILVEHSYPDFKKIFEEFKNKYPINMINILKTFNLFFIVNIQIIIKPFKHLKTAIQKLKYS